MPRISEIDADTLPADADRVAPSSARARSFLLARATEATSSMSAADSLHCASLYASCISLCSSMDSEVESNSADPPHCLDSSDSASASAANISNRSLRGHMSLILHIAYITAVKLQRRANVQRATVCPTTAWRRDPHQ